MTVSDTFALYGDTFPVTYYNGSEYVDTVASNNFSGSTKSGTITIDGVSVPVVFYQVTGLTSLNTDPSFITAELRPQYSIYDTYYIYQWCGLSSYASISSSVYSPPSWLYNVGGSDLLYEGSAVNSEYTVSYNLSSFFGSSWSSTKMTVIPIDYDGASTTYGYSKRIRFYGNGKSQYNNYVFFISCPYISGDAFGSSGTPAATSSNQAGGNVNVTVDVIVDMDETNSLLEDIWDGITGLASGIADALEGLFIPSTQALENFSDSVDGLLQETFGALYDAEDLTHEAWHQLLTGSAVETIYLPAFSFSSEGVNYTLSSGRAVQLKPFGGVGGQFSLLYTTLATIIDIVSTILFLNMLRDKFETIFTGHEVYTNAD